ncbi:hypothetical protein [Rugosimonospora africana]|uniref:Uncharacterized protein n=1 Tax=Rugosimonospora africana TaxID=556532 RepID=A0A8J3VUE4_9ACTN|nr:hypothetical protein [Rugosimonospora africana]GIH18641.1 hypothetical protein Raf01_68130 [Rugosimonospora africana]
MSDPAHPEHTQPEDTAPAHTAPAHPDSESRDTGPGGLSRRRTLTYGAAAALGTAMAGVLRPNQPASAASTNTGPAHTAAANTAAANAATGPSVVLSFSDPAALFVVDAGSRATPELRVTVTSAAALTGSVAWSVNARSTQTVRSGTASFAAPAGTAQTTAIPLGALGPDYYRVTATVTDAAGTQLLAQTLGLGVVRPTVAGVRPDSAFGLGIRSEGDPAITKRIAALMGVKWTRGVASVQPTTVSPAPNTFWGQADIDVARAEVAEWVSHGIQPTGFINYNMAWNVQPGANGQPLQVYQNRPKDLVAYADMVYHAIAPLQDLVKNWELWNEPWVHGHFWSTGDSQDYRDMTKLIWDRVKPEFPDVNLIGGGSVSYNRDAVYAKGSTSAGYIDGSVNHAYGYPDAAQYAMAKTQVKMDKLWSRTHGKGGQWQTECGTAVVDSFPDVPVEEAIYGVARTLAPTYLLHMLAGAEEDSPIRIFWFSLCYDKPYSGQEFNIYDIATKTPLPAVVAYTTMTSLLEDARLESELYPDAKSTWGFLFRTADGKGRAAVYADQIYDGTDEHPAAGYRGTLTLSDASGIRVYDYLGRQLADGSKSRVTLTLSPWEVLYFETDRSADALGAVLTTNATFAYDTPLVVTPLALTGPLGQRDELRVRVENTSPTTVTANLRVAEPPGWKLRYTNAPCANLKPGEQRVVSFPISGHQVSPDNQYRVDWTVRVAGHQGPDLKSADLSGSGTVRVNYLPYRSIVVGGGADQWSDIIPVTLTSVSKTGDSKQYVLRGAWDDDFVYFRAEIQDAIAFFNPAFATNPYLFPFQADDIQLGFDTGAKPDDLLAGDRHYEKCLASLSHLYVATLASKTSDHAAADSFPQLHRQCAPGTNYQTYYPTNAALPTPLGPMDASPTGGSEGRVQITRDAVAKVTTYEVAIAWSQLPELAATLPKAAGQTSTMVFGFAVGDAGTGGHGQTFSTTQSEAPQSGCYNFAPFWGTGAQYSGGRVDTLWGLGR